MTAATSYLTPIVLLSETQCLRIIEFPDEHHVATTVGFLISRVAAIMQNMPIPRLRASTPNYLSPGKSIEPLLRLDKSTSEFPQNNWIRRFLLGIIIGVVELMHYNL